MRAISLLAAVMLCFAGAQAAQAASRHRAHRAIVRPPVANLDICTPSPECDYGPIYGSYPAYGNVSPANLGDCTFAAAAHWEQIILGITPEPGRLAHEFYVSGGAETGLTQEEFLSYWQQSGIGGIRAAGFHRVSRTPTGTRDGVRTFGALIAELSFVKNAPFAQYWVSEGLHEVVVDGFTPKGPLVVSWGDTLQMSWAQWHAETIGMWAVEAGTQ